MDNKGGWVTEIFVLKNPGKFCQTLYDQETSVF